MKREVSGKLTKEEQEKVAAGLLWLVESTDYLGFGQHLVLMNCHRPNQCAGQNCVVHNPSDHHMRDWPLLWRADKGTAERICPCGMGHPDPDDFAYHRSQGRKSLGIHGCCGEHCNGE